MLVEIVNDNRTPPNLVRPFQPSQSRFRESIWSSVSVSRSNILPESYEQSRGIPLPPTRHLKIISNLVRVRPTTTLEWNSLVKPRWNPPLYSVQTMWTSFHPERELQISTKIKLSPWIMFIQVCLDSLNSILLLGKLFKDYWHISISYDRSGDHRIKYQAK